MNKRTEYETCKKSKDGLAAGQKMDQARENTGQQQERRLGQQDSRRKDGKYIMGSGYDNLSV